MYGRGRCGFWIGASCVREMVNRLTIFSFIVLLLWIYGLWFWAYLVFLGLCHARFWGWQGSFGRHQNGYIWSIIPHCLMWCLWRERNCRCFEDYESSIPDLKLLFFRTLMDWLFALQSQSFPSFIDFLDSCNFCL